MRLVAPRTYRWSQEEFHQMAELGWFDEKRIELIDGEIIEMPVQKGPHALAILVTEDTLEAAFGPEYHVRTQHAINLDPSSEPEPDVAVVPGKPRDYPD